MCTVNVEAGVDGLSFDDFMQQAVYFFSQRNQEEGLKYIFELFDRNKKGYLDREEFIATCVKLEVGMTKPELSKLFDKAANKQGVIEFNNFAQIMRKEELR